MNSHVHVHAQCVTATVRFSLQKMGVATLHADVATPGTLHSSMVACIGGVTYMYLGFRCTLWAHVSLPPSLPPSSPSLPPSSLPPSSRTQTLNTATMQGSTLLLISTLRTFLTVWSLEARKCFCSSHMITSYDHLT